MGAREVLEPSLLEVWQSWETVRCRKVSMGELHQLDNRKGGEQRQGGPATVRPPQLSALVIYKYGKQSSVAWAAVVG